MTKQQQDTINKIGGGYVWCSCSSHNGELYELILSKKMAVLRSACGTNNSNIDIIDKLLIDIDGRISQSTFFQYIENITISEAKSLIKRSLKFKNFK